MGKSEVSDFLNVPFRKPDQHMQHKLLSRKVVFVFP